MPKQLKGYVTKVDKSAEGTLEVAVATDFSVDRQGDRIDPEGWDLKDFIKNPVLLFAHNYHDEPIGTVTNLRKEGDRLLFTPKFAIDISEKAKRIYNLYKEGVMNAFSVGFIPREWHDEQTEDGYIRTFTRTELLEISAVPVPANANALVIARSKGLELEYEGEKLVGDELARPEDEPKPSEDDKPEESAGEEDAPDDASGDDKPSEEPEAEPEKGLKEDVAELKESVKQIQEHIAGKAGTDMEDDKKSSEEKVENQNDEVATLAKRVLQQVDKSVGLALRDLKKLNKPKK